MKRTVALLLTTILFFNWYGYQLLSSYWQYSANHRLEAALDRQDFEASTLVSIKISIQDLAYSNSSLDFQRVTGQITMGNISYKYVRSRLLNDSLELLCIPDLEALQIRSATNEYFTAVNGLTDHQNHHQLPHPDSSHNKAIQKDYNPDAFRYTLHIPVEGVNGLTGDKMVTILPQRFIPTSCQPPELTNARI